MKKIFSILFLSGFILVGCTNTRTLKNEINKLKFKNRELERRVTNLEQQLKKKSIDAHQEEVNLSTIVKRTAELNNKYVELYNAINEVRVKLGLTPLNAPPKAK